MRLSPQRGGKLLGLIGEHLRRLLHAGRRLERNACLARDHVDVQVLFGIVVLLSLMSIGLFYLIELIERLLLPRPLRRKGGDLGAGTSA